MGNSGVGSCTPEQLAARAEELGARVEFKGSRWRIYPPDPTKTPIFMARFGDTRAAQNAVAELRRAGLDVLAEQETTTVPATADAKGTLPTNGKVVPKPTPRVLAKPAGQQMEQRLDDLLELVTEQLDAIGARLDELESRLAATPGAPPARDPDADLDEAIAAFMTTAPFKLSADVIAANLDQVTTDQVTARLAVLAKTGLVVADGGLYRLAPQPS